MRKQMEETAEYIKKKAPGFQPEIGLILGSGLGVLAEEIKDPVRIPYSEIPNLKTSSVKGHAGELFLGVLENKKVMVFKGRIHFYEGHSMQEITFSVRMMQAMGVKTLVITNACGGLKDNMRPGDLMVISDHINLMGTNPLMGINDDELGPRFPDMSNCYDLNLRRMALRCMEEIKIDPPVSGVYCAVSGPNYETFAETRYIKAIGADAVGMSTVPEVIVAAHAGIKVVGVSCITDVIHEPGVEVTHDEVLEVARKAKPKFLELMRKIVSSIP
ncbi:MAG: purine-nucleoside phosphorylase [Vulcanimicrobiota bacterium]